MKMELIINIGCSNEQVMTTWMYHGEWWHSWLSVFYYHWFVFKTIMDIKFYSIVFGNYLKFVEHQFNTKWLKPANLMWAVFFFFLRPSVQLVGKCYHWAIQAGANSGACPCRFLFQGTSAEQDNRFSDKEKKMMKQMRFSDNLSKKVQ